MHLKRLLPAILAALCFPVSSAETGMPIRFDFSRPTPEGFPCTNGSILCRTANGAAQTAPGILEVSKNSDCLIDDSEPLHFKDTLTVSVWLYQPEFTGDYQTLLFKGSRKGAPQIDFMLCLYDSFPEFKYLDERGLWHGILRAGKTLQGGRISVPFTGLRPLPVRKWTMLTAVFNAGRIVLYVDGKKYFENSSERSVLCSSRHPLRIGRGERIGGETAYLFRGFLDNLLLCGQALSPEEVGRLYESEKTIVERNEVKEAVRNSDYDPLFRKKLPAVAKYEKTIPADLLKTRNTICEVRKLNGIPRLFINGKVHDSTAMMPSPYVGHAEVFQSCRDFAAVGIHIYSDILWTTHPKKQWWTGEGQYDFTWIDERIRAIVKADPEALIFPRVKLDPPAWWSRKNPDQMITDSDGTSVDMVSMASEKWTALYSRMLRDLITHMESMDYAGHIIGYQPAGGQSSEWGCNTGGKSDYSPAAREAFRKWVGARYENNPDKLKKAYGNPAVSFGDIQIPSKQLRNASEHLFFREGPESRIVFDYREFLTDITVRNILNSCGIVKEATDRRKIAGIFYGCSTFTVIDLPNLGFQGLRRILNSNDVDFLCSPAVYSSRPVGQSAIYQSFYTASYRLHNKFFWEEADLRTHLYPEYISYRADTPFETVSMMRRSFGYSLTKDAGLWWFLIAGNAIFHQEQIMKEVADMESMSRAALTRPVKLPGDVAVFVSEESFFHTNGGLFANELVNTAADVLTVSGISFDYYILPDIAHSDFPDYKVYLFLNAFRVDPEIRKAIDEKVKRNGKVALWLYAPGYIGPEGIDVKGMESLTGIRILEKNVSGKVSFARLAETSGKITSELAAPVSAYQVGPLFYADDSAAQVLARTADNLSILVLKDMRTWKSIYSLLPLSPGLVRGICDFAGVHVYSRSNDVLSVNDRYLMLHAASAGRKTLFLPAGVRARDLFTGKQFLPEKGMFRDEFKMGETKIYELLK